MTRPFCTILPPATQFVMPTLAQLKALRRIVLAVHDDWLGPGEGSELDQENIFRNAFWTVGLFHRTREVRRDKFFHSFVEAGNDRLEEKGFRPVDGRSFLLAVIAHADVRWQRPDSANGALPEIGLDPHAGLLCANRWRQVLTGEANLLAPTPARTAQAQGFPIPKPRLFQASGVDGPMRELIKW